MDFDFTNEDGEGVEIEADKQYGITLTVTGIESFAGADLTPAEARAIAESLNTAADYMEDNK